jgi:hypothetical protein
MERFWKKVKKTENCWEWTANKIKHGYGRINFEGRPQLAHRVSWILSNGNIPYGFVICHRCDNPSCVRPDHLFIGTMSDNKKDSDSKNRSYRTGKPPIKLGKENNMTRFTKDQILEIRSRYASGEDQYSIGRSYSAAQGTISNIVRRKSWKHI